ncbi:MAG: hypothetical protein LKJ69_00420 [Lactobacillus sp.]|nr:hypothetical protein [Lactobacillus sp.]MCI2031844.1 hypothetical protein [Lactobacillus sp.]
MLGGDFSKRLDFYDEDRTDSTFGHLPQLISNYFDLLDADTTEFKPYVGLMRRLLYGIIRPDFPHLDADHQLCIAVLVEPGTFTLRDLLAFLDGVSFVKLATAQDDIEPDVIITTLTSPNLIIDYYGPDHADVIQWQSTAAEEDYYRLYAELARRHHLKNVRQAQR